MLKETKIFVVGMIAVSAAFFIFNLNAQHDIIGNAFYISDGRMGVMDSQYPYRDEVASVNTLFWGFVLILLIGYIVTMHFIERNHSVKKKK